MHGTTLKLNKIILAAKIIFAAKIILFHFRRGSVYPQKFVKIILF